MRFVTLLFGLGTLLLSTRVIADTAVTTPVRFEPTLLGKGRFEALERDVRLPGNKTGFRLTLLELGARGNLSQNLGYRVVWDAAVETSLLDFFVDYRPAVTAAVRFGQFKVPFGRQEIGRTGELAFPDRAMLERQAPGRDLGVMVYGEPWPWFGYAFGSFNGEGRNLARNINNAFLHAARLAVTPWGNRADTSEILRERKPGLSLAVNGAWNYNGDIQNADERSWGGDVSYFHRRFGLVAEWNRTVVKPPSTVNVTSYRREGFYIQPVVMLIAQRWEWAARYERFDANTSTQAIREQYQEALWLGTNVYLPRHHAVLQLAYGKIAELEGLEYKNNQLIAQIQVRWE